jgi:hypothetical protein
MHGQLFFQDPATKFLEFAITFHHDVMLIMICFFCLVLWFIIRINYTFFSQPIFREIRSPRLYRYPRNARKTLLMHQFSRNRKIPKGKIIYKNHNTLLEIV